MRAHPALAAQDWRVLKETSEFPARAWKHLQIRIVGKTLQPFTNR
jgi:hypothetical protein